jgi:DNA primase
MRAKTDAPKYLNSPDTPLFDKGRTLYNLHRAGPPAPDRAADRGRRLYGRDRAGGGGHRGCGRAAGHRAHRAPDRTAVAAGRNPVLCFDGDAAGQRAAMRAVTRALPMLRPAHSLRIVRLPAGMDPDDLLKRDGPRRWRACWRAPQLLDMLWEHERDAAPLATPGGQGRAEGTAAGACRYDRRSGHQGLYRRELLDRFSAFAFPPREERTWQPGAAPPPQGQGARPRPVLPSARASRFCAGRQAARAMPCPPRSSPGLMRWPGEIARHADALARTRTVSIRASMRCSMLDDGSTA